MEYQSLTGVLHGPNQSLHQDISHLDIDQGSWCVYVHSVSFLESEFRLFSGPAYISCNLVTTRSAPRKISQTPLVTFSIQPRKQKNGSPFISQHENSLLLNVQICLCFDFRL